MVGLCLALILLSLPSFSHLSLPARHLCNGLGHQVVIEPQKMAKPDRNHGIPPREPWDSMMSLSNHGVMIMIRVYHDLIHEFIQPYDHLGFYPS